MMSVFLYDKDLDTVTRFSVIATDSAKSKKIFTDQVDISQCAVKALYESHGSPHHYDQNRYFIGSFDQNSLFIEFSFPLVNSCTFVRYEMVQEFIEVYSELYEIKNKGKTFNFSLEKLHLDKSMFYLVYDNTGAFRTIFDDQTLVVMTLSGMLNKRSEEKIVFFSSLVFQDKTLEQIADEIVNIPDSDYTTFRFVDTIVMPINDKVYGPFGEIYRQTEARKEYGVPNNVNYLIVGPPGTGKSYGVTELARALGAFATHVVDEDESRFLQTNFSGYTVPDSLLVELVLQDGNTQYVNTAFYDFVIRAQNDPENLYLLSIEELMRTQPQVISALFSWLSNQTTVLSNVQFWRPENLLVVATANMNIGDGRTYFEAIDDDALLSRFSLLHLGIEESLKNVVPILCSEFFTRNDKLAQIAPNEKSIFGLIRAANALNDTHSKDRRTQSLIVDLRVVNRIIDAYLVKCFYDTSNTDKSNLLISAMIDVMNQLQKTTGVASPQNFAAVISAAFTDFSSRKG